MMKVLVIDDDADITEMVSILLLSNWKEIKITWAVDGTSGIEKFQAECPDVIILDIGLPDKDGFEVCKEIRLSSDVPVVMLSIRNAMADREKAFDVGANEYVTKPFSNADFLLRVQTVVRRHKIASAA